MNRELEDLIRAYDAACDARDTEAAQLSAVFGARMDAALATRPGLSRESLLNLVRHAHRRWLRAQQRPPALPPQA